MFCAAAAAPGRGRLVEDDVGAERRLEIDVGAADPLEVEPGGERRHLEGGAAVVDAEMAGRVGHGGAEGVVLQPVGVEGADRGAGNRRAIRAGGQPAAEDPGVEEAADVAPEPEWDAVPPDGETLGLAGGLPRRLQRGDRELARLRLLVAGDAMGNVAAVQVDLEGLAAVLLLAAELEAEGALGVGLGLGEEQIGLGLDLVRGEQGQGVGGVGDGERGDVRLGAMPVEPDRHVRERLLAFAAEQATESSLEGVTHDLPPRSDRGGMDVRLAEPRSRPLSSG